MLLRGENIPRSCYLPWGYHKIFKVLLFYFEKMKMPLFIQRISWLTFRFLYVFLGCCIRLATECPRRRFGVSIVLERTFVANGQLQCPVSRSANFFTPANLVTELWNATHHLYSRCSFADDRYWPSHSYEVILQHLPENCRKKLARPWPQKRSTMQRPLAQRSEGFFDAFLLTNLGKHKKTICFDGPVWKGPAICWAETGYLRSLARL